MQAFDREMYSVPDNEMSGLTTLDSFHLPLGQLEAPGGSEVGTQSSPIDSRIPPRCTQASRPN